MPNNFNNIAKAFGICTISFWSICFIGSFLHKEFSNVPNVDGGLFDGYRGDAIVEGSTFITKEELEEEYEGKKIFPSNFLQEIDDKAHVLLNQGSYKEFDDWLFDASITYQESPDSVYSIFSVINNYRSALVVAKELESDYYAEDMKIYLKNSPNDYVLASILLTLSTSTQINVFCHIDSLIFPPLSYASRQSVFLNRVDVPTEDELKLISKYNAGRTEDYKFIGLSVFEIEAYGRIWEITLGQQKDFTFTPISIFINEDPPLYPITVSVLAPWAAFTSSAQLDKLVRDNFSDSFTQDTGLNTEVFFDTLEGIIE